jgi:hypothetical protein
VLFNSHISIKKILIRDFSFKLGEMIAQRERLYK